jgi:ATP-dependent 26S proteasome regulatory subunit
MYFVDLPHEFERWQILRTTVIARGRNPDEPETATALKTVVQITDGFSGAELAAVIDKAITKAFIDNKREIQQADLIDAARTIVPLSKSAAESLKAVREWAQGRALPASLPAAEPRSTNQNGSLDLD